MLDFIAYAEKRWGNRIGAYILSGGGTSEWYEYDRGRTSANKDAAWVRWCKARGLDYGETVPPRPALAKAAFENLVYDPKTEPEKIEYWKFHNSLPAEALLGFAKAARAAIPKTKEIGAFFGYFLVSDSRHTSFGHLDYERVYASPDIDFFIAPGNYSDRGIGGGSGSQLVDGTALRHGKRFLHEIDFGPHDQQTWGKGIWKTLADDLAGNTREAAFAMSKNASCWWFDMWGGFYRDPAECRERYDCAGWADMEGGRKMTPDTLFAVFSMTKTFTGAAVMCAIDEGKLSLEDAVSKFLPEFADVKMMDGSRPKRCLTIRDMMCHVTGFRGGCTVTNRDIPLREVARRLAAQPLLFQPGETFAYGNSWICTAAACVEVATGEPFERYLQTRILDPLGMKDTTFWPNDEQVARLAKSYNSDNAKLCPADDRCVEQITFPKKTKIYPAASGGLFSTPRDMVRFSQMLAHHGEWKGKRVISRETFDRIFSVKQTPAGIPQPYTCGSWLNGDWFGHEGAMRTDQRANLKTGHCRVFFIQTQTANRAGSAFFRLKREWHDACDRLQGTEPTHFEN